MITKKQTANSRKKSVNNLKNGQWRKRFDEMVVKFETEIDWEMKESYKSVLNLMSMSWGIRQFENEYNHAQNELKRLGIK